jgi:flagellar basal body-associated protein FliL
MKKKVSPVVAIVAIVVALAAVILLVASRSGSKYSAADQENAIKNQAALVMKAPGKTAAPTAK